MMNTRKMNTRSKLTQLLALAILAAVVTLFVSQSQPPNAYAAAGTNGVALDRGRSPMNPDVYLALFQMNYLSKPRGITTGPDGNLWFAVSAANEIAKITPSGVITEFAPLPTQNSEPSGITTGPDGNLWFTEEYGNKIGKITPGGAVTEYPLPTDCGVPTLKCLPFGITTGPDGNLWFTESDSNKIGRITPNGTIKEFLLPAGSQSPTSITNGPDGKLWFISDVAISDVGQKVGKISPIGNVTQWSVPLGARGITAAVDGNLWFTNEGCYISKITPAGVITVYYVPNSSCGSYGAIAAGPDGNLWFPNSTPGADGSCDSYLFHRFTMSFIDTTYQLPNYVCLNDLTAGPDGSIWFTVPGNDAALGPGDAIGRLTPDVDCPGAPDKPFVLSPIDGAWFSTPFPISHQVFLDWLPAKCATSYTVEIRKGSTLGPVAEVASGLTLTQHTTVPLTSGAYYWRVKSCEKGRGVACSTFAVSAWRKLLINGRHSR